MGKVSYILRDTRKTHRKHKLQSISETITAIGFLGYLVASCTADGDLKFFAVAAPVSLALIGIGYLIRRKAG